MINTFAGNGSSGYSGDNGVATSATLNVPKDIRVDSSDNLLIVDQFNHVVRLVKSGTSIITAVVGTSYNGYTGNSGYAVNATLEYPLALTLDWSNTLYIADFYNNVIRKTPRVP